MRAIPATHRCNLMKLLTTALLTGFVKKCSYLIFESAAKLVLF